MNRFKHFATFVLVTCNLSVISLNLNAIVMLLTDMKVSMKVQHMVKDNCNHCKSASITSIYMSLGLLRTADE